ncbi:MAG: beta-lactamase family protein [Gemmatimonadaceae bacterium]|nr:beta-lactamase family protein [Gemmatimonadaceae bacterium]
MRQLIRALLVAMWCAACRPSPGIHTAAAVDSTDAQIVAIRERLTTLADSARVAQRWPGVSIAVALPNGTIIAVARGYADTLAKRPLTTDARLLQGSVGKTYVAAVAMQLVAEGTLVLDAPISRYLGDAPWLDSVPNGRTATVRQIMQHTSGLVRYEFQPTVTATLRSDPFREWTPLDRLRVLFGTRAPFAAGTSWEYSDTNYIVLGMIIERLTGRSYYDVVQRRVLGPLQLNATMPSDRRAMPMVANGYAGPKNELGGYDGSIGADGLFAINPQFEWTGGGMASTTGDLARWAKLLYEGKAFAPTMLPVMLDAVPARLGPNVKYGLGVMLRPTALGISWGHSGFFPGYATEMAYFPYARVAVALQINITDPYPRGLMPLIVQMARAAGARDSVPSR